VRVFGGIIVLVLATAVVAAVVQAAGAPENDVWAPLQFLVGTWSGVGSGKPGEAMTGSTTFSYELDRKVLVRKNRAEYPPKPGQKTGQVHEDLLVIYPQPDSAGFKAVYFDNEGHVINYTIPLPSRPDYVIFDSEAPEKSPRFQLVYETTKEGLLSVEFLMAPPGGELRSYTKGVLKREK